MSRLVRFIRLSSRTFVRDKAAILSVLSTNDSFITLGGIMTDYMAPYEDAVKAIDPYYSGCMSNLMVNGQRYPLTVERGWKGWSIRDCDGTACGAEV